jgi:Zn-dependent protease with chaperone function
MGFSLYPEYEVAQPVHETEAQLATFLNDSHWQITHRTTTDKQVRITAQRTQRAFLYLLNRVTLHLQDNNDHTTIQFRPKLHPIATIAINAALLFAYTTIIAALHKNTSFTHIFYAVVILLTVPLTYATDRDVNKITTALRRSLYNQSGIPVRHTKAGYIAQPGELLINLQHLSFLILIFFTGLQIAPQARDILLANPTLLLGPGALLFFYFGSLGATGRPPRHYGELPNLAAASTVIMFTMYPAMRSAIDQVLPQFLNNNKRLLDLMDATHRTQPIQVRIGEAFAYVSLAWVLGLMVIAILQTIHLLHSMRAQQQADEADPDMTPTNKTNPLSIAALLLTWGTCVAAQAQAVHWAYQNSQQQNQYRADTIWIALLITAYATIPVRIITTLVWRTVTNKTAPQRLQERCDKLARQLHMQTPRIKLTQRQHSTADNMLALRSTLTLAAPQLALLNEQEQEALILHELAHVKRHAPRLTLLRLLGSLTLCGEGLLSVLIRTKDYEFEADKIAANTLGDDGPDIVKRMLFKLDAHTAQQQFANAKTPPPTTGARELAELWDELCTLARLVFGGGGLWYQHPTLLERLAALQEQPVCHP